MKKLFFYKIFLILLLFFSSSYSEVYKTIDEDGNVIFTDKKPSTYSEEMELKEAQTIKSDKSTNLFVVNVFSGLRLSPIEIANNKSVLSKTDISFFA